jgi:hypothetical protein
MNEPVQTVVQLRLATLPAILRPIAVHHWFVVFDPEAETADRWEVWQHRDVGGESWGHLHRNLMYPDRRVGGGPTCTVAEWRGEEAHRLRQVLEAPEEYPFQQVYRYWPGPNSNTYAAWVLDRAALLHDFDPRGVGKDYLGCNGIGFIRGPAGVCLGTPILGCRWGRHLGAELHLFGLTLGAGPRLRSLKTPFGSIALRRPPSRKVLPDREKRLDDLVEAITDENLHGEVDFGPPVGRENW